MKSKAGVLVVFYVLLMGSCTPTPSSFSFDTVFEIPLGNVQNVFHISKIYDPGPQAENYKLEFQFRNLGGLTPWPGSVHLWVEDMEGNLLEDFTPTSNGHAVTMTYTVRPIRIVISTVTRAQSAALDFSSQSIFGGMLRLQITHVSGKFLPYRLSDSSPPEPIVLPAGEEIILLRAYDNEFYQPADYNWYRVDPAGAMVRTIYVSPFAPDAANELQPRLMYSQDSPPCVTKNCGTGYSQSPIQKLPESGDTGIYEEMFPFNAPLYLAVTTHKRGHVLLTVQNLKQTFSPVTVEMDETLNGGTAPGWDQIRPSVLAGTPGLDTNTVSLGDTFLRAYSKQINDYIQNSATYPERIHEMLAFATARSLAGTEGLLRFSHFDIFHSVDPFRDTDLNLEDECNRSNATAVDLGPFGRINIYLQEMNNPERGGKTLLHEWGHYDLHYLDEYRDAYIGPSGPMSDPIDPNSIMGYAGLWEFCSINNHRWESASGVIPFAPGDQSVWEFIQGRYHVLPGSMLNGFYPQNQGTYYDVLHKLDSLIEFNDVENPNSTPDHLHSSCKYCGSCLTGEACVDNACTVQLGIGEICTRNEECADGRRCDNTRSPNRCIPDDGHGAVGDYCTHNNQCENNNCVGVGPHRGGICTAQGGIGAYCETGAGCRSGLACDPNHRCSAGPNGAAEGQYCSNTNQCSTSTYCTTTAGGYCKRKREVPGDYSLGSNSEFECNSNEQCMSNYCDLTHKRCFPAQNEGTKGDFCVNTANCAPGRQCVMQDQSYGFCN